MIQNTQKTQNSILRCFRTLRRFRIAGSDDTVLPDDAEFPDDADFLTLLLPVADDAHPPEFRFSHDSFVLDLEHDE
jgi:hypothetical protein